MPEEAVPSYSDNLENTMDPQRVANSRAAAQWLIDAHVEANALKAGAKAPDFTLPDQNGKPVKLSDLLRSGPVVLAFYRGAWCPYCNLQLRTYQAALPHFEALGATLIAVSPQTPDNSMTVVERNELTFPVLTDAGNAVAGLYGLPFTLNEQTKSTYQERGNDLEKYNGDDKWQLPVPGTFVIDRDGTIRLAFAPADYTQRLEPAEIVASLEKLAPAIKTEP